MKTVSYTHLIGYVIGEKYWNQGYMSEAFEAVIEFLFTQTPITKLRSIHHLENIASGRVMQYFPDDE